ncbi:MAG: preprotein translocase subunit SecG [Neisseria sp.]|nr:preprotein translocase subunit SecG [Neisseria sp.]
MEAFKTVIWIINIFAALSVIVLVLLQQGKGAEAGAAFGASGSGSAQGVFGSAGSANFLSRTTAICATVFFASCMALVYIHTHSSKHGLDLSSVQQSAPATQQSAPVSQIPAQPAENQASSAQ